MSPVAPPDPDDALFLALASTTRRAIIDLLIASPGLPLARVAERFDMSSVAVLKHVNTLESAGLLISDRAGRERRLYFNAVPIQRIYDRWTDQFAGFWAARVTDLKDRIEATRAPTTTTHTASRPESQSA